MRTTRTLLAALSLALLAAACAGDPVAPAAPGGHALRDGNGTTAVDSTLTRCGTGFCGSGN